jgi:hypothetical protein
MEHFIPVIVSDGFTILWTIIYILIKTKNLIIAKQRGISEKELIESYKTKLPIK